MWNATVAEHHRLREDIAVVRLIGDAVPFRAGQSLSVIAPRGEKVARRLSPALPPSLDGKLEFHVRSVPGGWMSGAIVTATEPGDVWNISEPRGTMAIDNSGRDVIMAAGGTGLAPLRALLLDISRRAEPPRVYLFTGGRSPRDLYAADMLYLLAAGFPWLTVVPIAEQLTDPDTPDPHYERVREAAGFPARELIEGTLPSVLGSYGGFTNHQVLVCGSPAMTHATVAQLIATGTPEEAIQHDPC